MIDFSELKIGPIFIHKVGNKLRDEGIDFGNNELMFENDDTKDYLMRYLLSPFNNNEVYNFHYSTDINLNDAFVFSQKVFEDKSTALEMSKAFAKHLYDKSLHPKINEGEFCFCYLQNCFLNGIKTNAIGLFKSERKDVFLKLSTSNAIHDKGINIEKLDKGCLIFDLDKDEGYKVCIVDSNRVRDAQYWMDDFLSIVPTNDDYHKTNSFLSVTKDFITKELSSNFELNKADKIDFLNRSVNYFKENTTFDKNDFEEKVFEDAGIIDSFRNYENNFKEENEVVFEDNFEISSQAVKKQARKFKSVLKLDKNFHIYIHGDRDLIEQGIDEKGRKFYKIYYEEEN